MQAQAPSRSTPGPLFVARPVVPSLPCVPCTGLGARDLRTRATTDGSQQGRITFGDITSALSKASNAWEVYDKDRNGSLCIDEVTHLINGPELREALLTLTNITPKPRTRADLEPFFRKADTDKSGGLSRTEFLAMYLALATERVASEPVVLAEALLGFIDVDRNGRIEGGELKKLLTLMGFPMALLLPIPANLGVDYRSILDGVKKFTKKG